MVGRCEKTTDCEFADSIGTSSVLQTNQNKQSPFYHRLSPPPAQLHPRGFAQELIAAMSPGRLNSPPRPFFDQVPIEQVALSSLDRHSRIRRFLGTSTHNCIFSCLNIVHFCYDESFMPSTQFRPQNRSQEILQYQSHPLVHQYLAM